MIRIPGQKNAPVLGEKVFKVKLPHFLGKAELTFKPQILLN